MANEKFSYKNLNEKMVRGSDRVINDELSGYVARRKGSDAFLIVANFPGTLTTCEEGEFFQKHALKFHVSLLEKHKDDLEDQNNQYL